VLGAWQQPGEHGFGAPLRGHVNGVFAEQVISLGFREVRKARP
jgi:hypothetical protein